MSKLKADTINDHLFFVWLAGQLAKQERECLILLKGDKAVVERAPETVRKLKFVRSQSQGTPTPGGAKRQSGAAKPPGSSKSKVAKASSRIIKE